MRPKQDTKRSAIWTFAAMAVGIHLAGCGIHPQPSSAGQSSKAPTTASTVDSQETPATGKKLVWKAIQAHGGLDAINRIQCGRIKYHQAVEPEPEQFGRFSREISFRYPDAVRQSIVAEVNGNKRNDFMLTKGDKSWFWTQGSDTVIEVSPPHRFRDTYPVSVVLFVRDLFQLAFELSDPDGRSLDGTKCNVVSATYNGLWYGDVYFDATSNLLVAINRERGHAGEGKIMLTTFRDFKSVDGVAIPFASSTFSHNRKVSDDTLDEIVLLPSIPDAEFELPASATVGRESN
jgi:hypothetical protein